MNPAQECVLHLLLLVIERTRAPKSHWSGSDRTDLNVWQPTAVRSQRSYVNMGRNLLVLSYFGISKLSASVHLARRVLQLERQNTSLRRELDSHRLKSEQASEQVHTHTEKCAVLPGDRH